MDNLFELLSLGLFLALPGYLLLAAAGLPFLNLDALIQALRSGKGLSERRAQQLSRLTPWLDGVLLLAGAGLFVARGMPGFGSLERFPDQIAGMEVLSGLLLLAAGLLALLASKAWKALRTQPWSLALVLLLSGLCVVLLMLLSLTRLSPFPPLTVSTLSDLIALGKQFAQMTTVLFEGEGLVLLTLGLGGLFGGMLATSGGFALLWLLVRRKVDDFGRDYYNAAALWFGRRAALGGWLLALSVMLLLCIVPGLPALRGGHYAPELPAAVLLGLSLSPGLWTGVALSSTPMRHKIAICLAPLCLLASLAGAVLLAMGV